MAKKTVLLAEDDPGHEALFRRVVPHAEVDCELVVVHDGVEALEYLFATGEYEQRNADEVPDLFLLDLRMPRMDGLQVLQVLHRVRGVDRRSLPPVIVLTSSEREDDIAQAYELGAQSYICKPMNYPEFADTVCDTLEYWLGLNRPAPRRHGSLSSSHSIQDTNAAES
ncbi:MAG: response regulator [Thermoguttaceae bacterium]